VWCARKAHESALDVAFLGTVESCGDDVCRSAYGTRAVLSRLFPEGRVEPYSDIGPRSRAKHSSRPDSERFRSARGNVTGQSLQQTDVASKRVELLRDAVPGLRRMAILLNVGNANAVLELGEIQAATRTLGLAVATSEIRRGEDIVSAFEALKGRADAIYVVADPLVFSNRARIHTIAMAARLPAIYNSREYVEMGGLMSYGPNFPDMFRRAADMVDKILRGVKPGDLPVEQPTQFDLVINLTTAKALSLDVPPTLLARADEVIE
jgi:putative tryptophan/tyrosine transport system substrate-binding protein